MKKRLCLLALLSVSAAVLLVWAHVSINSCREQVSVEERTVLGDKSAAAGLTASWRVESQGRLFWDLSVPLGGQELEPEASFRLAAAVEGVWVQENSLTLSSASFR